jgi:hypothetical protein
MPYCYLVRKQFFNLLLISSVTIASYYIASIWGYGNPIVQSKDFFWVIAGAIFSYLFILPWIMLLLEKNANK